MLKRQPERLRRDLVNAEQALARQEFDTCIRLCDGVLGQDAINLPAHLFRGVASGQVGQLERAVRDLSWVLEQQPENAQAAFFLGQALRRSGLPDAALRQLKPLLDNPQLRQQALFETAMCLDRLGRVDRSINYYKLLLSENPRHADAAANLSVLLERSGQLDEALAWAERALLHAPGNVASLLTQARVLRRQGAPERAERLLRDLLQLGPGANTRVIALNQLGQCLDRQHRYAEAFEAFREANEVHRANDPEALVDDYASYGRELVMFLRNWLQAHPPGEWSQSPADDREAPVFLVGFPLSGGTLLAEALARHPLVEVIEEQELLLEVRRKWMSADHYDRVPQMAPAEVAEARRHYRLAQAAARRKPLATVVVDKLPLNAVYLHLIYRLFPDARVVQVVRDPRDACLACYFQTFQLVGAMPYFLELDSTVDYYDAVMSLATHALDAFPFRAQTVRYENLVADPGAQLRALGEFLGIPADAAAIEGSLGTGGRDTGDAGMPRANEPGYPRLAGHWRNYSGQLEPYMPRLQPWVERLGYGSPV